MLRINVLLYPIENTILSSVSVRMPRSEYPLDCVVGSSIAI